jgi:tRNA U34 2-thiouridine synthase MnmA/TrmU
MQTNQRVVVGLSRGVDSAVSAHLLKQQGFEVIDIFTKNWEDDDDSEFCPSSQDSLDAASVAESFLSNLKSERIKRRIYSTRAEAKSEIFDYIEGFYNRVRRHKHLDQLSPYEFERQRQTAL